MSIRAKYEQQANIPALYNAPRTIAGQQHNLTDTGKGLYATQEQACNLLGIAKPTFLNHLEDEYADFEASQNKGGSVIPTPLYLTVLLVQASNAPIAAVGGGGGTQTLKLYNLELVVRVATRTRNTPEKQAIINEMIALYSQYQHHGFLINEPVLQADPVVLARFDHRVSRVYPNMSADRLDMAYINNMVSTLAANCLGMVNPDGSTNQATWTYFHKCCHNTAHISAVNMTALQIRYTRADPTQLSFGQQNFRGVNAPWDSELNNACNFLTDWELRTRRAVVDNAVSRIMTFMMQNGKVHWKVAVKMFTMHSVSQYVQFISWDYRDYPDTAIDNVVNMLDPNMLRGQVKLAIEEYKANFPNRHRLSPADQQRFANLEQDIVDAALEYADANY